MASCMQSREDRCVLRLFVLVLHCFPCTYSKEQQRGKGVQRSSKFKNNPSRLLVFMHNASFNWYSSNILFFSSIHLRPPPPTAQSASHPSSPFCGFGLCCMLWAPCNPSALLLSDVPQCSHQCLILLLVISWLNWNLHQFSPSGYISGETRRKHRIACVLVQEERQKTNHCSCPLLPSLSAVSRRWM